MLREKRYKQIVHTVEQDILDGKYRVGDRIASINSWCIRTGLSRSSVMLALDELKSRGIIEAEQSVGYFVSSTRVEIAHRILLVFGEYNLFKEDLYNSIVQSLGPGALVDIVFHHYNQETFNMLLENAAGKYTVYVVMPGGSFDNIEPQLKRLGGKVILVDHFNDSLKGVFSSVSQDFANDTYEALVKGISRVRHYREIILIQSRWIEPRERYDGVKRFCQEYELEAGYLKTMEKMPIKPGTIYLTPEDREIVTILSAAQHQGLTAGVDFGLVSYNDTVLKEIIAGGLTTITTDFIEMGRTVVELMRDKDIRTIHNPCRLILRNTL
jgi:DNA-binding LacI/PurR family transcriptional regulator